MPNILLISFDDLNDSMSILKSYGGLVHTPNFDRLVAQSVVFANAYCTAPVCIPSRSSVLTGLSPLSTGVMTNDQGRLFDFVSPDKTLPSVLRANGFVTATAGKVFDAADKTDLLAVYDFVLDDTRADNRVASPSMPEAEYYSAKKADPGPLVKTMTSWQAGYYLNENIVTNDSETVAATEEFLRSFNGSENFFLSVGLHKPHVPWYLPKRFYDLYPLEDIVLPPSVPDDLNDVPAYGQTLAETDDMDRILAAGEWRELVQAYLASVSYADEMLGRVLDALAASSSANDTVIVVWSDHGYHLGEKQSVGKNTLWEQSTSSVFLISDPSAPSSAGQIRPEVVSLLDLFPTVLDYAGVPATTWQEGQSVRDIATTGVQDDLRGYAVTASKGSYALRADEYRYIRYEDGSEELYDHRSDPGEIINRIGDPTYDTTRQFLSAKLDSDLADRPVLQNTATSSVRLVAEHGETFIIGGFGTDTLVGGPEDTIYLIRSPDTRIEETTDGGMDTVFARASFKLPKHVENLSAIFWSGPQDADLAGKRILDGNSLDNRIEGVAGTVERINGGRGDDRLHADGNSLLKGGPGNDTAIGEGGDNTLDGGRGNDLLVGGEGDDRYIASAGHDVVVEKRNDGLDSIDVSLWGLANTAVEYVRDANGTPIKVVISSAKSSLEFDVVGGTPVVERLVDGDLQFLL